MDDANPNLTPDIERIKHEHRALAILRALEREPSYCSNGVVLSSYLAMIGLPVTRAELNDAFDQLERANLVQLEKVEAITVIELKEAGLEVVKGLAIVDGVLRPGPDCPY